MWNRLCLLSSQPGLAAGITHHNRLHLVDIANDYGFEPRNLHVEILETWGLARVSKPILIHIYVKIFIFIKKKKKKNNSVIILQSM